MRKGSRFVVPADVLSFSHRALLALLSLAITSVAQISGTSWSGCTPTTDPGACNDGTGPQVCNKMQSSTVYHLTVEGSNFAPTGACLYVTNQTGTLTGDVVLQAGSTGTSPIPIFSQPFAAAGLRNTVVAWDSTWEQVGSAYPGSLLAAAGKMEAVLDWIYANIRGSGASTAYCAWGASAGSSALLYAIAQYGEGDSKLDHVQVQAATPFARIDVLCNPTVPNIQQTVCPDVTNIAPNQYPGPGYYLHSSDCMTSNVTQTELEAWAAQSIVSSTEQTSFHKTTISAFYCQNQPNFTVPQGTYFFGPTNTNISIDVPVNFYNPDGTVYCGANKPCHPYLYCAPTTSSCVGEVALQDPKVKALEIADMINNCTSMHNGFDRKKPAQTRP